MSQAEELLRSLAGTTIEHKHEVPDSDTHFLIDPYTRQIENTNYQKTVLMRGDHNSERFTFELPRYVDGHDMSLCNRVVVHFDNVDLNAEDYYSDVSYMDDLRINPDKPDTVISSWLIRREATQYVGVLSFSLQYQCVENGEITYEWNTDSYDDIEIRKSKNNGEAAVIQYTNVLEQWRSQIFGAGDSVMTNIANEGAAQVTAIQNESSNQQTAIELKASETLATIPDDYTEVYNMANEALRTKADSIVCDADGTAILVTDSSDDHLRGLNVYGKSTQYTTSGKNKLNLGKLTERVVNGVTLTPVYDNGGNLLYLNLKGTSTSTFIIIAVPFHIAAGTYEFTNFKNRTTEDRTLHAQICDSNSSLLYPQDAGLGGTFTFNSDVDLIYRIFINEGRIVNNEKLYPMLRDITVSDSTYEPFTGGVASPNPEYPQGIVSIENPSVTSCGANLFNLNKATLRTGNGLTGVINSDGSITVNGTPTSNYAQVCSGVIKLPIGRYYVSGGENATGRAYFQLYANKIDGTQKYAINSVFEVDGTEIDGIHYSIQSGIGLNPIENYTLYPMFNVGTNRMEFETYKGLGTVTTQARTLRGIPVSSGGNYVDLKGQHWVCDEIDFERRVYIQRIGDVTLNNSMTYKINNYQLNSRGKYVFEYYPGNVITVEQDFPVMSDKLITDKWGNFNTNETRSTVYGLSSRIAVHLADQSVQTIDAFKSYVAANPIRIIYALATPIESPLTAEEIVAYKSVKTNYPNTSFVNDASAWMDVKYNADLKRYAEIDKQKVLEDILDQFRDNVTPARISTVTLYASAWEGTDNLYSQIVNIDGVTENSQVDLTPGIDQLAVFYEKDLSFVTENNGGIVTVYAIGQKPTNDYTIQVTITEVEL